MQATVELIIMHYFLHELNGNCVLSETWRSGIGGDISGITHFPWIDLPKISINADVFMTFSRRWATVATVLFVITLLSLG
jgi:hypothetical protein